MNKEERKKTLLTLPIEILVDLVIAGDEIEERNAKAIEYIDKEEKYMFYYVDYRKILKILKGEE